MLDEDRYLAQLCGLAANPSLPRPLLDRLVTAASGELRDEPDLSPGRALDAADLDEFVAMAEHLSSSPRHIETVIAPPHDTMWATINHHGLPAQAAKNPNTTAETLLLCLENSDARRDAARHPNLPPHVITQLLDDPDLLVAEAAAANPALPKKVMEALLAP